MGGGWGASERAFQPVLPASRTRCARPLTRCPGPPSQVSSAQKEVSGFVMGFFLQLGIFTGSQFALLFKKL